MTAPPSEAATRLTEMLECLVAALDLRAEVVVSEDSDMLHGELRGDDLGLAIGRHGQTIDAIQHLAYRIAFPEGGTRKRLVVDAAGYRERRAASLAQAADRAADEAVRARRPVRMEAMNAVERRVVHEHLRDRRDVETYSEGEEPDRHLVVAPLAP